jgi:LysM repeat protein
MQQEIKRWGLIAVGSLLTLLLASGCFQSAGESLQATSVAQGFATFTPEPSETPTEAPPAATETPADLPEFTEEPDSVAQVEPPLTFDTVTPTADGAASVAGQDETDQAASVQEQIEPPEMTATALIERATQQAAIEMTQTAEAMITLEVPTLPPTAEFPTATPFIPVTQPPAGTCIHVVSAGENLFRISLRYGTTVHVLAAANGIPNINLILVGQRITIPNCTGGSVPPPPPGGGTIHTVMQGENLFRISLRYGVSLSALLAANPQITNPNLIYINQQIVIPI